MSAPKKPPKVGSHPNWIKLLQNEWPRALLNKKHPLRKTVKTYPRLAKKHPLRNFIEICSLLANQPLRKIMQNHPKLSPQDPLYDALTAIQNNDDVGAQKILSEILKQASTEKSSPLSALSIGISLLTPNEYIYNSFQDTIKNKITILKCKILQYATQKKISIENCVTEYEVRLKKELAHATKGKNANENAILGAASVCVDLAKKEINAGDQNLALSYLNKAAEAYGKAISRKNHLHDEIQIRNEEYRKFANERRLTAKSGRKRKPSNNEIASLIIKKWGLKKSAHRNIRRIIAESK